MAWLVQALESALQRSGWATAEPEDATLILNLIDPDKPKSFRRHRRQDDGAGIPHRAADDEDPAALLLAGIRVERLQHGPDGTRVEGRRRDVLRGAQAGPARVPTATATARSRMCEMLTASGDVRPSARRRVFNTIIYPC